MACTLGTADGMTSSSSTSADAASNRMQSDMLGHVYFVVLVVSQPLTGLNACEGQSKDGLKIA